MKALFETVFKQPGTPSMKQRFTFPSQRNARLANTTAYVPRAWRSTRRTRRPAMLPHSDVSAPDGWWKAGWCGCIQRKTMVSPMRQKRRQQNEKGIFETRSEEDQLPVHQSSRRVGPILRSGVDESYRLDPMGR